MNMKIFEWVKIGTHSLRILNSLDSCRCNWRNIDRLDKDITDAEFIFSDKCLYRLFMTKDERIYMFVPDFCNVSLVENPIQNSSLSIKTDILIDKDGKISTYWIGGRNSLSSLIALLQKDFDSYMMISAQNFVDFLSKMESEK